MKGEVHPLYIFLFLLLIFLFSAVYPFSFFQLARVLIFSTEPIQYYFFKKRGKLSNVQYLGMKTKDRQKPRTPKLEKNGILQKSPSPKNTSVIRQAIHKLRLPCVKWPESCDEGPMCSRPQPGPRSPFFFFARRDKHLVKSKNQILFCAMGQLTSLCTATVLVKTSQLPRAKALLVDQKKKQTRLTSPCSSVAPEASTHPGEKKKKHCPGLSRYKTRTQTCTQTSE